MGVVAPTITLFRNVGLTDVDTGGQTSTVGEPSLAASRRELFYSGNWYATKSLDAGASWTSSTRSTSCLRLPAGSAAIRS